MAETCPKCGENVACEAEHWVRCEVGAAYSLVGDRINVPTYSLSCLLRDRSDLRRQLTQRDARLAELEAVVGWLVKAMTWWGQQEDGVPEDCWNEYNRAKASLRKLRGARP